MVRTCKKRRLDAVLTSHIQIASSLFLGGGSLNLPKGCQSRYAHTAFTTMKWYARYPVEFSHVGDKVHIVCLDGVHAHDKPGGHVEDGE